MKSNGHIILLILALAMASCTQNNIPKDKAYPRYTLPARGYQLYQSDCPYQFEYPTYASIEDKKSFFANGLRGDSCWININFNTLNATLHISYKDVANQDTLTKLMEDAYKLTVKHTMKADYIKDSIIDDPKLKGIWYDVGGNAASSIQFFLTDQERHYLRGSLYFKVTPNIDSMRPIVEFVTEDVRHLIHTFKWNN
ncbi:MAG: hypothetical protein KA797_03140 [Chitinophagales bacterium]|nr:hypothetical protein [Chitinophagales bacterium]